MFRHGSGPRDPGSRHRRGVAGDPGSVRRHRDAGAGISSFRHGGLKALYGGEDGAPRGPGACRGAAGHPGGARSRPGPGGDGPARVPASRAEGPLEGHRAARVSGNRRVTFPSGDGAAVDVNRLDHHRGDRDMAMQSAASRRRREAAVPRAPGADGHAGRRATAKAWIPPGIRGSRDRPQAQHLAAP